MDTKRRMFRDYNREILVKLGLLNSPSGNENFQIFAIEMDVEKVY